MPFCKEILSKIVKDNEATLIPSKNFFSSLTNTSLKYTTKTASLIDISQKLTPNEADSALTSLTNYLNKNLATLCLSLSTSMGFIF